MDHRQHRSRPFAEGLARRVPAAWPPADRGCQIAVLVCRCEYGSELALVVPALLVQLLFFSCARLLAHIPSSDYDNRRTSSPLHVLSRIPHEPGALSVYAIVRWPFHAVE